MPHLLLAVNNGELATFPRYCNVLVVPRRNSLGRPLKGRDPNGKPISVSRDYVQMTVRLAPEVKATLDALAMLENRDRSTLVTKALTEYVERLPSSDREAIVPLASRVRRRRQSPGDV